MTDGDEGMRRVTVVTLDDQQPNLSLHNDFLPSPVPSELDGCEKYHRLKEVLVEIADMVRLGAYRTDDDEGVLLDAIVGNVRCLFIEQRPSRLISLSPRERQIARMVAGGRTNQAIASSLDISVWTVSTHLRRIFAKLAVSSRAEMVAHLLADPEVAHVIERSNR
jgi:DNA-binding CsgD family transcriptional regulator